MATPNRFAIRDAGEATFYNLVTGDAIVTLRSLRTSGVTTSGETVYAQGGRGHVKIVGFSSNREARIELEDAIFDKESLAMLTGNALTEGKANVDHQEVLKVATSKVTLSKTPVANTNITVFVVEADGTNGRKLTKGDVAEDDYAFSISGKEITVSADVTDGTNLRVYYVVETDVTAKTIKVTSDAFGGTFRVVIDVLVRDEFTKKDYAGQIQIPNGKFEDNFELSLASDGDPAVLTMPIEILKDPLSTDMWKLVIYDAEEIE